MCICLLHRVHDSSLPPPLFFSLFRFPTPVHFPFLFSRVSSIPLFRFFNSFASLPCSHLSSISPFLSSSSHFLPPSFQCTDRYESKVHRSQVGALVTQTVVTFGTLPPPPLLPTLYYDITICFRRIMSRSVPLATTNPDLRGTTWLFGHCYSSVAPLRVTSHPM